VHIIGRRIQVTLEDSEWIITVLFSSLPLIWDWFLPVEETIKNVRTKTIKIK